MAEALVASEGSGGSGSPQGVPSAKEIQYTSAAAKKGWLDNVIRKYKTNKIHQVMDPLQGSRAVALCKALESTGDHVKWLHQSGKRMREILLRNKKNEHEHEMKRRRNKAEELPEDGACHVSDSGNEAGNEAHIPDEFDLLCC